MRNPPYQRVTHPARNLPTRRAIRLPALPTFLALPTLLALLTPLAMRRLLSPSARAAALLATAALLLLLLGPTALLVTGCDDSPQSVDDFALQPDVRVSTSTVRLVARQSTAPTVTVTYQGLASEPTVEATGALTVTERQRSGTPSAGGRLVLALRYDADLDVNAVTESVVVRSDASGRELIDEIAVDVLNPISSTPDFQSHFATVADFETRTVADSGAVTTTVVTDEVAPTSNGTSALRVQATGAGAVTFTRAAHTPDLGFLYFLIKPDPASDLSLTLRLTESDDGASEDHLVPLTVPAGEAWLRYSVAVGELFATLDPVAERAGGNGALERVTFTTAGAGTFHLDEITLGVTEGALVEIEDFEATSNPYVCSSLTDSDDVAVPSDGFVARRVGQGCFGYNYDGLRPGLGGQDVLSFWARGAAEGDELYVFLETPEGAEGRPGDFTFDNGVTVALTPEWALYEVEVGALGTDASVIGSATLSNVGFDAGGADGAWIDDIKLRRAALPQALSETP